ncbi:ribosomal RNA processing protein 1 homolog B [Stigmatopora nigra]
MAEPLAPEILLAQKLASNEKSIRTKALKKLRKYINLRSQKATGGFTSEELLKLWKGLFYCLWMQDKPLLQEELSNTISKLINSFHNIDGQMLYFESSLKTFKREWSGIDRLRMDKFFQLVRFMFRHSFELLKSKNWESSVVARFLDVFATEILISGNNAPTGLQLHILDLYLTELGVVGSKELTADQNLQFIEPFFKTAVKTKDMSLLRAVCNIFNTIIEHAPFAIEDLIKELKTTVSSDSGQFSEGEGEERLVEQINGSKLTKRQRKRKARKLQVSEGRIQALQFDYKAVADKLFEMSSKSHVPNENRRRIYKIVKILLDLSEGFFPPNEDAEVVSTDEEDDDDIYGKRKRKKSGSHKEQATNNKNKKTKLKNVGDSIKDDVKPIETTGKNNKMPKRKKTKAKPVESSGVDSKANVSNVVDTKVTNQSKNKLNGLPMKATKQSSVSASEPVSQIISCKSNNNKSKKNKKRHEVNLEDVSNGKTCPGSEMNTSAVTAGGCESTSKSSVTFPSEVDKKGPQSTCEVTLNELTSPALTVTKTNKKGGKAKKAKKIAACPQQTSLAFSPVLADNSAEVCTDLRPENLTDTTALTMCKTGKKHGKMGTLASPGATDESEPTLDHCINTPMKKKNKQSSVQEQDVCSMENEAKISEEATSLEKPQLKRKRKIPVTFEFEADELESSPLTKDTTDTTSGVKRIKKKIDSSTPKAKPKLKKALSCSLVKFQRKAKVPTPLFVRAGLRSCKTMILGNEIGQSSPSDSKKVTFHLNNNKTAEFRKNDRSLLVSPDGSSKVPFDPKQKPKSGVLKSSPIPLTTNINNSPTATRKVLLTPKSTPRKRPTAADFF